MSKLTQIMAQVNKTYGEGTICLASEAKTLPILRKKWGIFSLDCMIGGGVPLGRVIMLHGPLSSGKTTTALKLACAVQQSKEPNMVVYIDAEGCIAEDQEIFDPVSGFVGTVKDYMENDKCKEVMSWVDGKVMVTTPSDKFDSGVCKVVAIKTKTTSLKATERHPVLTWRKGRPTWVKMSEIKVGDKIARVRRISDDNIIERATIGKNDAELLGMLIGAGDLESFVFTNVDSNVWKRLSELLVRWDCKVNKYGRIVTSDEQRFRKGRLSSPRDWVRDIGLWESRSEDRFIPPGLFYSTKKEIGALLTGLWMTDGTVNSVRPSASYATTSRKLAIQVRFLLGRLGILGLIASYPDNDENHATQYRVTVNGTDRLKVFHRYTSLYSYKGEYLNNWCNKVPNKLGMDSYLPDGSKNDSDVWWDEVIAKECCEDIRCWDATVPKGSSWVVNDIVVHNTFDLEWAQKQGVDLKKLIICKPDEGQKGLDIAEELVRTKECGLLVLDSVATITPREELEASMEDWQMGLQARVINKFIRKITSALQPTGQLHESDRNNCIVLLLNQERATMDKYKPVASPGGQGKEFAASIIIQLRRGDWIINEDKEVVGHEIYFKTEKNKCLKGNTEVFNPVTGEIRKIMDIDTSKVVSLDLNNCKMQVRDAKCYPQKIDDIYKVTTSYGHSVEANLEHPVLTKTGWVNIGDVKVGEPIGVCYRIPWLGNKKEDYKKARVVGYLLGDGYIGGKTGVTFISAERALISNFEEDVSIFGCEVWHKGYQHIVRYKGGGNSGKKSLLLTYLRDMGLLGTTSFTKFIPKQVFKWSKESVAEFLSALFSTDGNVDGRVRYYSVSEKMIKQIRYILLSFGIYSTISLGKASKYGNHRCWLLTLNGVENIRRFNDLIGIKGDKGIKLSSFLLQAHKECIPRWQRNSDGDIFWDEIVSIERVGKERVYDISVGCGKENLCVNSGIIVHNTYPPRKEGCFDFYTSEFQEFKAGDIDNIKSVILYGIKHNIIKRNGSFFDLDGKKFQGKEPVLEYLKKDTEKYAEVKKRVLEFYSVEKEVVIGKEAKVVEKEEDGVVDHPKTKKFKLIKEGG